MQLTYLTNPPTHDDTLHLHNCPYSDVMGNESSLCMNKPLPTLLPSFPYIMHGHYTHNRYSTLSPPCSAHDDSQQDLPLAANHEQYVTFSGVAISESSALKSQELKKRVLMPHPVRTKVLSDAT